MQFYFYYYLYINRNRWQGKSVILRNSLSHKLLIYAKIRKENLFQKQLLIIIFDGENPQNFYWLIVHVKINLLISNYEWNAVKDIIERLKKK